MSSRPDKRDAGRAAKGAGGESHRMARVEKEVRDVIGTYLFGGFGGKLPGLVSLTRVQISADLKIANINVTLMMTQDEGETMDVFEKRQVIARKEAVTELNEYAKDFQGELARRLQMRFTPKVHFHYDDGFESALQVEKILRKMSEDGGRGSSSGSDPGTK